MNAGAPPAALAACFVLPLSDDLEHIMQTLTHAMLIQKAGGGNGFSFSPLRPKGSPVAGTNGVASGPVSFVEMFDAAASSLKQGGRRHGANMAILRVDHPDILEFVEAKRDVGKLTSFNTSVAATDDFMAAVLSDGRYDLVDPRTGSSVRSLPARQVFRLIAKAGWRCGDPGLVFIDEINRHNPLPSLGPIEATNPCGEQPLEPFGACCLALWAGLRRLSTRAAGLGWRRSVGRNPHFFCRIVEHAVEDLAATVCGLGHDAVLAYPSRQESLDPRGRDLLQKVGSFVNVRHGVLAGLRPCDAPALVDRATRLEGRADRAEENAKNGDVCGVRLAGPDRGKEGTEILDERRQGRS